MTAQALRDAPWLSSQPVMRVLGLLNVDGEEARVIGGAVRNALLGLPVGEIDIATTALPDEVMRRAKAAHVKAVPTGIAHGTVTLVAEGEAFEVTTLREDVETFGRILNHQPHGLLTQRTDLPPRLGHKEPKDGFEEDPSEHSRRSPNRTTHDPGYGLTAYLGR